LANHGLPQVDGVVVAVTQKLPKLSGTRIATAEYLATLSDWLSVDQLHMPEEQVSW